jgi:hypothetical protein
MANITQRIEDRLSENKAGVKTYASHQFAEAAGERIASKGKAWANSQIEMEYIVVFLPHVKRWTVVFHLSAYMRQQFPDWGAGGYIGWASDEVTPEGFFTI